MAETNIAGYTDSTWLWRRPHANLLGELLSSGFKSDFTLLLGPDKEKVPVHKIFLQFVSPVLNSRLGKCSSTQLEIADVDPAIFKLLLKYVYTGDSGMTITDALPLLKMATDFEIVPLADKCATLFKTEITQENVLPLFQGAMEYAHGKLIQSTLAFICKNGQKVLKLDDFVNLRLECLVEIIQQDGLKVLDEIDVFNAVHRWGQAELVRAPESLEMRKVLSKALTHVRFPLMDPTDFALNVANKNVLDASELTSILTYFHTPEEQRSTLPQCGFSSSPRTYIQLQNNIILSRSKSAFDELIVATDSSATSESLMILCNTQIALKGLTLPKELINDPDTYHVDTDLLRIDIAVTCGNTRVQCSPPLGDLVDDKYYQINFDSPIKLSRSQATILKVKITGMVVFKSLLKQRSLIPNFPVRFDDSILHGRVVTNFINFVESPESSFGRGTICLPPILGNAVGGVKNILREPLGFGSFRNFDESSTVIDLGLVVQRKNGDKVPMTQGVIEKLIFGPI